MEKEEIVALIDEIVQLHGLKSVREFAGKIGMPATTLLTWYGGKVSLVGELYLKEHKENLLCKKLVGDAATEDMEKIKKCLGELKVLIG